MKIQVSARHTTVKDRDREAIIEKIDRLGKFLPGMESAEVHFSAQRNPRIAEKEVCEVTLEGHGHHVRCTASGPDHLTAVDRAMDKLENKLHKLKTKLARKPSHRDITKAKMWAQASTDLPIDELLGASLLAESAEPGAVTAVLDRPEAEVLESPRPQIVRSKRVEKLVLSPVEAAERMDLVSHDFYFFTNIDTGRAAVVYRRHDGDIGLIDEEAAAS